MAVSGIPLCVVVSPLLFAVVIVVAHLIDLVAPLGPEQWAALRRVAFVLPELWGALRGRPADVAWSTLALFLVAPGMLLMLVAWPFVRRLQRVAGAGTILRRIPSREPDSTVLREQQLANVVAEMAVAAGVPVPRVRIIDSRVVNVAAIGLTTEDATIVATSGFLRELDRDERQAMVAHLIGSVGNGDLEIAAVILSVLGTWGLLSAILEATLFPTQRRLVRRFAAASARSLRGRVNRSEARAVVEPLMSGGIPDPMQVAEAFRPESCLGAAFGVLVLAPLLATVGIASIAARQLAALLTVLGFGPWLAAMWRARRRLADATAVQLTRHPSALASAVRKMGEADVVVPGGWPVSFLFPVWVAVTGENAADAEHGAGQIVGMRLETAPRLEHLARLGASLEHDAPRRTFAQSVRQALPDRKELTHAALWSAVATVLCAVLAAVSVVLATAVLAALWWVLSLLLTPLRWLRR